MADNVAITAGLGTTIATDDIGGVHYQIEKVAWGPLDTATLVDTASGKPLPVQLRGSDGTDRSNKLPVSLAAGDIATGATSIATTEDAVSTDADTGVKILVTRKDTPANTSGTDGDYEFLQISGGKLWTHNLGDAVTVSTDITRPADTTAYTANDNLSDSTSAPTSGGFTLTSAARKSGGSGIITDLMIVSSNDPATRLQGEIWFYNQAATADNDNAAFTSSDSDTKNLVGVVPFTMLSTVAGSGTTSYAHVQNLTILFTCSGTANLRYKVKVKNAYTPASAEVITTITKILQID